MSRVWIILTLCCCFALAGLANDSHVVGAGGRVRRVDGEQTTVRMVREWVKMDVYPEHYDVAVQFVFHNDGPATTVQMGFPESGHGDIDTERLQRSSGFLSFRTWVDGREAKAERLPLDNPEDDDLAYETFWVKTVSFARGQTRTVRVEYRSPHQGSSMGDRWASYDFTGGNWAGKVEESTLGVTLHLPGSYLIDPGIPMTRQENRLSSRWTHWQAEMHFSVTYMPIRPDAMTVRGMGAMPFSWFSEHRRVLVQPGNGPAPICIPAAIFKNNVTFLNLLMFREYLRGQAERSERSKEEYPQLSWDAAAQTGTLVVGKHTFVFTLKQPVMQVNGQDVPLPAPAFLSTPVELWGQRISNLYIPAHATIEALGGAIHVNTGERHVELDVPPWWEE